MFSWIFFYLIFQKNSFAAEDVRLSFQKLHEYSQKKNWVILEVEAKKIKSHKLFDHYGNYYLAQSFLIRAQEEYLKKNYLLAIEKAKEARWKFSEIQVFDPYFPLKEKTTQYIFDSEILMGESYSNLKNSVLAVKYFENAFERIPSSQLMIRVDWANLRNYSRNCVSIGFKKCESWLTVFFEKYPQKSPEYEFLKNTFPLFEKGIQEKSEKKLTQNYKSEDKDDLEFTEIFTLYLNKEYSNASERYEKYLKDYPNSKNIARVLYWLSQCYKKRKKDEKHMETVSLLLSDYPFTYYGLMAALDIGKSMDEVVTVELPMLLTKASYLRKNENESIERIEFFIKNKLYPLAKEELNLLNINSKMPKDFLMYLADLSYQSSAYLASFRFLNEYFQREGRRPFSTRHLSIIFPEVYLEQITPIANKFKIDPLLILSLIKQESGFHAEAISHAGAVGLMQLMPFSAIAVRPKIYQSEVLQIKKNIELGIEHLANEIKLSKGNIPVALAAYNAGAGRARGWWNQASENGSNVAEFIELISYNETRGYVSGILRNYYWYTKRIQNKKISDFDFLLNSNSN